MLYSKRFLTLLVLVALLVSACQPIQAPAAQTAPMQTKGYTPRYEPAPCKYDIPEGDKVECGYLTVPEDRSHPEGRMIRLYVVNLKSKSAKPAPDPVVILHGGPGGVVPGYVYLWTQSIAAEMRAGRDNILLEHRGVNYSEPGLFCPEMEAPIADMAGMSFSEEIAWTMAAARACAARLQQEKLNLSSYSALEAAADVMALRTAMGYNAINVYGVSYGTVPAMQLMRYNPTGIRSIILDSIGPPDVSQINAALQIAVSFLNTLFHACATDPTCNAAYPDLEAAFYKVLAQLRATPAVVSVTDAAGQSYTVTVDDQMFVDYVVSSAFVAMDYLKVPAAIYSGYQGDFAPAAQAWLDRLTFRHGATGPGAWTYSHGLYYTANCLQDGTLGTAAEAKAIYDKVESDPSVHDWAVSAWISDTLAVCPDWKLTPPSPNIAVEPVSSALPTLMLEGAFDNGLPAFLSRPAAARLSNSYFIELPAGHALVLTSCGVNLINQFLDDPTQQPDTSCIKEMKQEWVLPK